MYNVLFDFSLNEYMPKNSKIAPTISEQDKLLSILYRSGVSRQEIEYAIPSLPTLLSSSSTLPNGKIVRLQYAIPGRSCISSGHSVRKTIIKANNGRLYDTFNMRGVIGKGGYGVVFVGQDLQTKTLFPLKSCQNEDTTQEQSTLFKLGIGEAWAQVAEPCGMFYKLDQEFSSVHGYNHKTYIVMKYLGESLKDTLERHKYAAIGPNFIDDSFTIAIEAGICLTRMHEVYDLAHLDLKPSNMFYRPYLPQGEKVELGDYATTVRAHKLVSGGRGSVPYTQFDEEYVKMRITAEQRDLRTFYRCLTGVNADNRCQRFPQDFVSGILGTAILHKYDLYHFLFFNPRTLSVDYELPKALIVTAKLIAVRLEVAVDAQVRILGREGLAVRIIANYIADNKSKPVEKKRLIEGWARNPDDVVEKNYLLLLKLNLLERADEAVLDKDLMNLLNNQELSYEYKSAVALLYKRDLLNEVNKRQLASLSEEALKMLKKSYIMKNWKLFSNLLDTDPSLINIEALNEQYFQVINSDVKPYFDDSSDRSTVENDGMDDVIEWSKSTLFNSLRDFNTKVKNVKHAFRWGAWQHTLMVNPSFFAVMQWLRNFDSSEVIIKIARGFYSQLTDLNLASVIFHLKDKYTLHQLQVFFDFEGDIADYLYSSRKNLEDLNLDNFANLIERSDFINKSPRCYTQDFVGYLLSTSKPPEYLMTLPQSFVHKLVITYHRVTNLNACLNKRSFVDACYRLYNLTDLGIDDVYYLSCEIERNNYTACELIAEQDEENPCMRDIFEVLRVLHLRYEIVASLKGYVKYFDKYPSLRLGLLNILHVIKDNTIYRATSKDLINVRKALLTIYKELDKLSSAIELGSLERGLLVMVKELGTSEYESAEKFETFIRGFVDTINNFVAIDTRMERIMEYDREQSSSSSHTVNFVSRMFTCGKLAKVAFNMPNTTYDLESCICELQHSEYRRLSQNS